MKTSIETEKGERKEAPNIKKSQTKKPKNRPRKRSIERTVCFIGIA
jgi:hypothetical protein